MNPIEKNVWLAIIGGLKGICISTMNNSFSASYIDCIYYYKDVLDSGQAKLNIRQLANWIADNSTTTEELVVLLEQLDNFRSYLTGEIKLYIPYHCSEDDEC